MSEVKSTVIVPISFYCFLLSLATISMAITSIMNSDLLSPNTRLSLWLPVISAFIIAISMFVVGVGILYTKRLYWRILFFSLGISVACITSALVVYLVFLVLNAQVVNQYCQALNITIVTWFTLFSFFLSQIIVLYYLSREEVIACFGGVGIARSPF